MSGHSKWATTKRQKAVNDAKRSSLFTKLSKNISVAAREGADPLMNFKLRIAIDKAKAYSMPKDNIERAIKRGSGEGEGDNIESLLYEVFGPEGSAFLVEVLTDNKNRTISNVKHILSKFGASVAGSGSVQWMFQRQVELGLDKKVLSESEELSLIEAGASDIIVDENVKVRCEPNDLEKIKKAASSLNIVVNSTELLYVPKEKKVVSDTEKILSLLDALDDDDDVNNIYTNVDI